MSERVIWERDVDPERSRQRTDQFRKMFLIPAAIFLAVVLVFSGPRNAIGVLILLGLIGLAWGMTVRFQNLSDAANPRLVVDRGRLILGNRDVIISDVKRYTAVATIIKTTVISKLGQIELGKVVFRMDAPGGRRDPVLVEFGWPNMGPEALESVKQALEPVLGDKWVEPQDILDPDERSDERRGRGRKRNKGR